MSERYDMYFRVIRDRELHDVHVRVFEPIPNPLPPPSYFWRLALKWGALKDGDELAMTLVGSELTFSFNAPQSP